MHTHGIVSNLADYWDLPWPVVEHARLLMEGETQARRKAEGGAKAGRR